MKKLTAILCTAVMSIGLLAGCASGSTADAQSDANASATVEAAQEAETASETAAEAASSVSTETAAVEEPASTEEALIRIGSLKGPTSMGLVAMMSEHPEYSYTMETAADAITASIVSGDLDIALVPANLASVLYNKTGGEITVIDINTLSVLYIVSTDDSIQSIADLSGKTVYLTGKGTTPDYALQYLLAENGLSTEDVTLEYKSEATEVAAALAEDQTAIGLLPQPFVTAACMQNENLQIVLSLGDEWTKAQEASGGTSSLVTGVTIVRNEFLESNPELVEAFLQYHAESAESVNADPAAAAEKIVELGIVAKAPIAEKAIPNCGITCITGEEMKAALEGYLQVLYDQNPQSVGGALPEADFYYGAE